MQDNQTRPGVTHDGLPVPGYRAQSEENINLVTQFKLAEENILRMMDTLGGTGKADPRWLAVGRTALEQGFMAINRSIFKPGRAKLPGDEPPPPVTTADQFGGQ